MIIFVVILAKKKKKKKNMSLYKQGSQVRKIIAMKSRVANLFLFRNPAASSASASWLLCKNIGVANL